MTLGSEISGEEWSPGGDVFETLRTQSQTFPSRRVTLRTCNYKPHGRAEEHSPKPAIAPQSPSLTLSGRNIAQYMTRKAWLSLKK